MVGNECLARGVKARSRLDTGCSSPYMQLQMPPSQLKTMERGWESLSEGLASKPPAPPPQGRPAAAAPSTGEEGGRAGSSRPVLGAHAQPPALEVYRRVFVELLKESCFSQRVASLQGAPMGRRRFSAFSFLVEKRKHRVNLKRTTRVPNQRACAMAGRTWGYGRKEVGWKSSRAAPRGGRHNGEGGGAGRQQRARGALQPAGRALAPWQAADRG